MFYCYGPAEFSIIIASYYSNRIQQVEALVGNQGLGKAMTSITTMPKAR